MSRPAGWIRATTYATVALTVVACGDLVNHDDERPTRRVPVAALYVDDGHPTVLLAPCEHNRVIGLTVSDGVRKLWSVHDGDPPDPATTVRIFVVPTGWKLDKVSAPDFTAIAPDRTYYLFASLSSGLERSTNDLAVDVTFTLADLTALRPDQVWTASSTTAAGDATRTVPAHRVGTVRQLTVCPIAHPAQPRSARGPGSPRSAARARIVAVPAASRGSGTDDTIDGQPEELLEVPDRPGRRPAILTVHGQGWPAVTL